METLIVYYVILIQLKKLEKAGFIGENNGDLTDDLNKIFFIKKMCMNIQKLLIIVQLDLKNIQYRI